MASHRVHVHVHIGNHHTGSNRTATKRRSTKRTARRGRAKSKGKARKYNTTTGSKPGSGNNFRALSGQLAKRGAKNPGALAAYIGRQKYGKAGFAKLGARGRRGRRR